MAIESKYKKRGSNLSLIAMLIILLGLVAAIIFWPTEGEATDAPAEEQAVEVVEEPQAEATQPEDSSWAHDRRSYSAYFG